MAKGLRSRSKLVHRTAKRRDEKSDYRVIEAARLNAVTARLQEGLSKPKLQVYSSVDVDADKEPQDPTTTIAANEDGDEAMQTEDAGADKGKKISTSGPRENSRTRWKKARKGAKSKKGGKR
ncbi:hypothetical protein ACQY0O_001889 [Thecaphora frezii]